MKNSYEAPQLTVVHFRTEAGFALSTVPGCQNCTFEDMTIDALNQFAQEQAFVGQNGSGANTGASDTDMVLYQVAGHRATESARGTLSGTDVSLKLGEHTFPFQQMADLAVRLHGTVTFSMKDGSYYELKKANKSDYSGRIYKCLFERFAHEPEEAKRL